MVNAFSRQGSEKVYVQGRLKEYAEDVSEIVRNSGYLYVCGNAARMARAVNSTLVSILANQMKIQELEAQKLVQNMRKAKRYQVCYFFHVHEMLVSSSNDRTGRHMVAILVLELIILNLFNTFF